MEMSYVLRIIYHLKRRVLGYRALFSEALGKAMVCLFWHFSYGLSGLKPPGCYDVWA